jgi:hypothetical protein
MLCIICRELYYTLVTFCLPVLVWHKSYVTWTSWNHCLPIANHQPSFTNSSRGSEKVLYLFEVIWNQWWRTWPLTGLDIIDFLFRSTSCEVTKHVWNVPLWVLKKYCRLSERFEVQDWRPWLWLLAMGKQWFQEVQVTYDLCQTSTGKQNVTSVWPIQTISFLSLFYDIGETTVT